MRIFVAGATGAIGRRLIPLLVAGGHDVTGMTRSPDRARGLEASGAAAVVCDVFDREGVTEAVVAARPEVVVHEVTDLPATIRPRRVAQDLAGNDRVRREGTPNLVAAAQAAGAGAFVAQSIAFAYAPDGAPLKDESAPLAVDAPGPWGESVRAVRALETAVLEAQGLRGAVLRYGYLYGPGTAYDPDGGSTAAMVAKRGFPIVGDGNGVFSFVHVDDAARATVAAIEGEVRGALNVVDDEPAALREWLRVYAGALGAKPPRRVPAWLARLVAGPFAVAFATQGRGASNARARSELGWTPAYASWRTGFLAAGD
jgi:nucleoside-diphosphate-sugar epimerase